MQFKKGHKPWNKGKKGIHLSPDSEFKSDGSNRLANHPSWKGGVQMFKNDCAYLAKEGGRVRRPRQKYIDAHGSIPKGFVILHIDGDNKNDNLDNLKAISRAELLKLNR